MADRAPDRGTAGRMPARTWILSVVAAAIAVGVAAALLARSTQPLPLLVGTALPEPRPIADFELIDQRGRPFGRASLEGRWSLLFTGFTNCPDVCPTTIALLAALRERLADERLQIVFVSVDPERDTPGQIARYLAHFDPDVVGATGTRAAIQSFTSGLGLAQVRNPAPDGDYTVDHSAALVLIDPRARVAGYFHPPHNLDAVAADLAAVTSGAG